MVDSGLHSTHEDMEGEKIAEIVLSNAIMVYHENTLICLHDMVYIAPH